MVIHVGDHCDLKHGDGNKNAEKWVDLELGPTGLIDRFDKGQGKTKQR